MIVNRILGIIVTLVSMSFAIVNGELIGGIGVGIVCIVFLDFLYQKKSWLPIGELALLLGGIQWIIAPLFAYYNNNGVYNMTQTCREYMSYTIPMYLAFVLGFYLFRKNFILTRSVLIDKCRTLKFTSSVFILVGCVFMFVPIRISSLFFIKSLLSSLFFIGFIIRMYSKPSKATLYLFLPLGVQLINSVRHGMFHELLVWGIFMIVTWFSIKQTKIQSRVFILLLSFIGIFLIQAVKSSYRQVIWNEDYAGSKIELFTSLIIDNIININEVSSENEESAIARYNQGWIISRIYSNIPSYHDYFYGRTYIDALNSAVIPRFLVPDKKGAGEQSRADFIEMTGYNLSRETSMGLSILGESYGNFGFWGGVVFMFFWGYFIAKIVFYVNKLSARNFMWIMFLPLICYNLIKAEISMMSVLNWTVKSFIFVFIVINVVKIFSVVRNRI